MFDPPPFNPELPCETIAENTFEALRIVRQGDWVYKFLRPHDSFPGQTAEERRRQILLRVRESHCHVELNPLWHIESIDCLVSRFVRGRVATTRECDALQHALVQSQRGHVVDIGSANTIVTADGLVIVDFALWDRRS